MPKFKLEDLALNLDSIKSAEEKTFMKNIAEMVLSICNKSADGTMSKEDIEAQFKSVNDKLAEAGEEKYKSLIADNDALKEQVKNLGESLEKLKQKGFGSEFVSKFDEKLDQMLNSEKFNYFAESKSMSSGSFEGFSLSDILATKAVSMSANYTGDTLISQQMNLVVSQASANATHLRDIINVLPGDPKFPYLTYAQIYDVDKNARYVSENGTLPESSFKVKEIQTGVKRLGTHIRMSKRMLKCRVYVRAFILNMLPAAVAQAEDWNILFGDGVGDNLDGIAHMTGVKPVEGLVKEAIITGSAGDVEAVETYDGGKSCIVTLKKSYDELRDGMVITFAKAAVCTGLNHDLLVEKMNDKQLLFRGVAYSGSESAVESMTFTVKNAAYKSIPEPNSGDVVKAAFAVMTYGQFKPNAICLNPIDVLAMSCEKDSMGRNLGLVQVINGRKYVEGYPVIELNQVAPGEYLVGDFKVGAQLVDYSNLRLEWAEDVNSKLANQVVLICSEEVILAVNNPWAFAYGKLSALKTAITKG